MQVYIHPSKDTAFVLEHLINFDKLCAEAGYSELDMNTALMIIDEAAKLGSEVLSPLNKPGDLAGAKLGEQGVEQAPGFSEAYQQYVEGGWGALGFADQYGGQPVPRVLSSSVNEIWQSANLAFALCPLLTQGAIEAIEFHGSEELKTTYLPKMISGEWTGTMNLTEPDAGSDLAAIKTTAEPDGDHYLIAGQKIFISWGDHQMVDNVIHLVLARLPDAPPGVKGISLFVVPKFLLDEQGNPGERNDVHCIGVEHKLGIHASPTCAMQYGDNGGAVGYLVGEPHNGLAYMFTMMNLARQAVGMQGLGVAEMAYQQSLTYAKERIQGTQDDGSRFPIIEFPDIRRMLMTIKATVEAMRGLVAIASVEGDKLDAAQDADQRAQHAMRYELFTPIVKGWMTEAAQEMVSLGVQIHGGMGFIEETGMAQYFRDVRILTIYEGTTGIQAVDIVGRKTLLNGGAGVVSLLEEINTVAEQLQASSELKSLGDALQLAVAAAQEALQLLLGNARQDEHFPGSVSVNYLMLFGWLCGGWVMGLSALKAVGLQERDPEFMESKRVTAQFYMEHLLPRVYQCLATIRAGSASIMKLSPEQF